MALSETQIIDTSDVRERLNQLLDQVSQGEIRAIIERDGLPVAALVSFEDLERFMRLESERRQRFKALEESWEAFDDVPEEEIEREVDRAITEARNRASRAS